MVAKRLEPEFQALLKSSVDAMRRRWLNRPAVFNDEQPRIYLPGFVVAEL